MSSLPLVKEEDVPFLLQHLYGITAHKISCLKSFSDRNFHIVTCQRPTITEENINRPSSHIPARSDSPREVMFKISNLDSFTEEEKAIAAQSSVLDHLTSAGFTVPVIIPSLSGRLCEKATLSSTDASLLCVLYSYIPGRVLYDYQPLTAAQTQHIGNLLAQFRTAVDGFDVDHYKQKQVQEWSLTFAPSLLTYSSLLQEWQADLLEKVVKLYQERMSESTLPQGLLHGDIHDENILVLDSHIDRNVTSNRQASTNGISNIDAPTNVTRNTQAYTNVTSNIEVTSNMDASTNVTGNTHASPNITSNTHGSTHAVESKTLYGLLDFSDMYYSCCLYDLAVAVAFAMIGDDGCDFVFSGAHVIAGYASRCPLTPAEKRALFSCVCAAYCMELVLCQRNDQAQKGQNTYLQSSFRTGWQQLAQLVNMGEDIVTDTWWQQVRSIT